MIEIGKNFLLGLADAQKRIRTQREQDKAETEENLTRLQALQDTYRKQMAYLFRTTNEKERLAYDTARAALANRQAIRAAHGVTNQSASAVADTQNTSLNQTLESGRTQTALQSQAAEQEKQFKRTWEKLLDKDAFLRRYAKRSGRLGSWGRALVSLFK